MVCSLAQFTDIRAALAVGGLSLQAQASDLRTKPEVVVATPVSFFLLFPPSFFIKLSSHSHQRRCPAVSKFPCGQIRALLMLSRRRGAGRGSFFLFLFRKKEPI